MDLDKDGISYTVVLNFGFYGLGGLLTLPA